MQNTVINVNGQVQSLNSPPGPGVIAAFDRAYLYGDSLYEVVRSHRGTLLHVDEHLARLEASAKLCAMDLTYSRHQLAEEIRTTFLQFAKNSPGTDAYVRLILSRGEGKIGFSKSALLTPNRFTIIAQPLQDPTEADVQKGYRLGISSRIRNSAKALDPAMKSGNYLNSLLAFLEIQEKGFDDALLCDFDGHVTEGTTFNIGYVRRGIICTPPLDIGILDGITRREMLDCAKKLRIETREVRFPRERLYEADEVFMTSTTKGVFPISHVDQKKIHGGTPGPITLKLRAAYQSKIDELAKKSTQN